MSDMIPGHVPHDQPSANPLDASDEESTENFSKDLLTGFVIVIYLLVITLVITFWLLYKPVS